MSPVARSGRGSPRGDGWSEDGRGRVVTGPSPAISATKETARIPSLTGVKAFQYALFRLSRH